MLLEKIDEKDIVSGHGAAQAAIPECQIGPKMGERRTERAPHRPEEDIQWAGEVAGLEKERQLE
eukprot:10635449-Heterocapsa_arctica.AAC.1